MRQVMIKGFYWLAGQLRRCGEMAQALALLERREAVRPISRMTLADFLASAGMLNEARRGKLLVLVNGGVVPPKAFRSTVVDEETKVVVLRPVVGG